MSEMTSAERVMCVLNGGQPDRIPHFEWIVDRKVREAIIPGCTMEEFTVRMGIDAILTAPDFKKEQISLKRYRNEWGVISEKTAEEHGSPIDGPIKTLDDLKKYEPPDPHAPGRYDSLKRIVEKYKGKIAIGVHLNDVFSIPRYLAGFETLMMAFAAEPKLVQGLVDLSVEVNLEMAREVARCGADFVFTGDDYASAERPFMSPGAFEKFLSAPLKRVIGGFRELGLPVIKHTDGNIIPIIDMIVDSGISCLDPIDPLGGLDMGQIKKKYGDRIALKGNVNCAQTLSFATAQQVVQETKEAIAKGAPGGGFILSSSNSIHSAVKPGNYLAMWNTLRMYGQYPINLDNWKDSGVGAAFS